MSDSALVLDNSILSALFDADWFDAPAFYHPEQSLLVSNRVWHTEFTPHHDIESEPDWLTVQQADLEPMQTRALGQLSKPDWSCIALAEHATGTATVVTNDRALRDVADRRGLPTEWGTHFVIRTFTDCGITVSAFEDGVDTYLADVTLPETVQAEVRTTEK